MKETKQKAKRTLNRSGRAWNQIWDKPHLVRETHIVQGLNEDEFETITGWAVFYLWGMQTRMRVGFHRTWKAAAMHASMVHDYNHKPDVSARRAKLLSNVIGNPDRYLGPDYEFAV
ncbi:TPA: hypothetical protein SH447_004499 [Salmonella enterica]|nr:MULTISPECIES: hypothetical protein [Bacilli]ELG7158500.1 hypothetical protein [Staphylococcus aureus]HEH8885983.1 hypothetical protein [Salmonella enterica]ELL1200956.1 hypothetical protein [Staphylococcus aureus]MDH9287409.1 hypothetical protein [Staphylococcus epidermidis]MDN3085302.1 hypothetical protein [Enterococcus faecalis]